jgi:hypothetical protein
MVRTKMYCTECGANLARFTDARFCPSCGAQKTVTLSRKDEWSPYAPSIQYRGINGEELTPQWKERMWNQVALFLEPNERLHILIKTTEPGVVCYIATTHRLLKIYRKHTNFPKNIESIRILDIQSYSSENYKGDTLWNILGKTGQTISFRFRSSENLHAMIYHLSES